MSTSGGAGQPLYACWKGVGLNGLAKQRATYAWERQRVCACTPQHGCQKLANDAIITVSTC